jgi:hypothetical protein
VPRLSDNTLLQRAIGPAVNDRESFYEAHHCTGEVAKEARALIAKMKALKGKKLEAMSAEEQDAARLCLIYAEQWESSLADANAPAGKTAMEDPLRAARLFREVRLRRWGKTKLEKVIEDSQSVEIFPRNYLFQQKKGT